MKFDENEMTWDALGKILVDAQIFHHKSFPLAHVIQRYAQRQSLRNNIRLTVNWPRHHVVFYAHESTTKAMRLPDRVMDGTVADLLAEFKDQGYISPSAATARVLELRLICDEHSLVRHTNFIID
jgi:hypothetical protein